MMSKPDFNQDEVVLAAGRAWHTKIASVILENGFPVASIFYVNESKNSFAGYGTVMHFQIIDTKGKVYLSDIGADMVAAAAQIQFPDKYATERPARHANGENAHGLMPEQIVPAPHQDDAQAGSLFEYLFGSMDGESRDYGQPMRGGPALLVCDEPIPVPEPAPEPVPESYSKRLRRETKELIAGKLPGYGIFKCGVRGEVTVVWSQPRGREFIYVSTAVASKNDKSKDDIGARIAYRRMRDGQSIVIPGFHGVPAENQLVRMFGRFEETSKQALWNEYGDAAKKLQAEYAERGLETLKVKE